MFHSLGTVQSRTAVPVGISCTVSGMDSAMTSRVARTPLPVMLRHSGYSRSTSACICSPSVVRSVTVGGVSSIEPEPAPNWPLLPPALSSRSAARALRRPDRPGSRSL